MKKPSMLSCVVTFLLFTLSKSHEAYNTKLLLRPQEVIDVEVPFYSSVFANSATLIASPSSVTNDQTFVSVTYNNIEDVNTSTDWIGLFSSEYLHNMTALQTMAPIKYKSIMSMASQGTLKFQLVNYRVNLIFVYARGLTGSKIRSILAVSNIVYYYNIEAPMHVHLATLSLPSGSSSTFGNDMMVLWTQKSIGSPQIQYGLSSQNLNLIVSGNNLDITTVTKENFCDVTTEPAATDGYFVLGYRISGNLTNLKPNTRYFYRVGDPSNGADFSPIYNFTSSPMNGDVNTPIRMIAFGDLGLMQIDNSNDEHNSETHSINTTSLISKSFVDKTDFVLHIGDISYARGYLSDWDTYLHQIQPISSLVPYMTGIGNHENGWSGEWVPPPPAGNIYGLEDSGGECSTVYSMYHRFSSNNYAETPDLNQRKPWYHFDYGMVRVVVMSTEHNWTIGSDQYNYIVNTMQSTNRKTQPWLILGGHRPMYWTTADSSDAEFAAYFQSQLENVLYKNKVALALWGHIHNYGRTCPIYSQQCVQDNSAPVQMVIGMSGFDLEDARSPREYWKAQNSVDWGFTYHTFLNSTHVHVEFINDATNTAVDDFYVINPLFS